MVVDTSVTLPYLPILEIFRNSEFPDKSIYGTELYDP